MEVNVENIRSIYQWHSGVLFEGQGNRRGQINTDGIRPNACHISGSLNRAGTSSLFNGPENQREGIHLTKFTHSANNCTCMFGNFSY